MDHGIASIHPLFSSFRTPRKVKMMRSNSRALRDSLLMSKIKLILFSFTVSRWPGVKLLNTDVSYQTFNNSECWSLSTPSVTILVLSSDNSWLPQLHFIIVFMLASQTFVLQKIPAVYGVRTQRLWSESQHITKPNALSCHITVCWSYFYTNPISK